MRGGERGQAGGHFPMDFSSLRKAIGPGILVACAAIGGSHLHWAAKAGALHGWSLLGLVLLANIFKYPFFLYGQRYTAATGESLLHGYRRQGAGFVWVFLLINVTTSVVNVAGVAFLSAALLGHFGVSGVSLPVLASILVGACALWVWAGRYAALDLASKVIISLLMVTTVVAVALAAGRGMVGDPEYAKPALFDAAGVAFLIALMGWMPAPLDLSAWSSLWMFSRRDQTGHMATVRESRVDFELGYWMSTGSALLFVALGALVMFGTGESIPEGGAGFAQKLQAMYGAALGENAAWLVAVAAFATMASTTLTCVDGYPRALAASCELVVPTTRSFRARHLIWVALVGVVSCVVLLAFTKSLLGLLSFAAAISFVTSPVLAWINLRVMSGENVPAEHRPGRGLRALSWAGLVFFGGFTLLYAEAQLGWLGWFE
jgi:Mn2+/Fe2+ NRAMP family transporter